MPSMIQSADEHILFWIQDWVRVGILNPLVELYTTLGNAGMLWIVLSLLLLCRKSTRKAGIASLCALAIGALCTNVVLKHLVSRPRPYVTMAGELIPLLTSSDPYSFPSGHTCAAFAAGVAWAGVSRSRWVKVIAILQAVFMGLSRLYVGVHYPSDVLAGALIGALSGLVALRLQRDWERRSRGAIP